MQISFEDEKPIFIQIAEGIEDAILTGAYVEEGQIPSITEFSVNFKINPATALKGINLLVEEGIIFKKRGVGMFVQKGAVEQLKNKRKEQKEKVINPEEVDIQNLSTTKGYEEKNNER